MSIEADRHLLLSAQQALRGHVTPVVRSVSFDIDGKTVRARAVFEREPEYDDAEEIRVAFTEVIACYYDEMLDEQLVVSTDDLAMLNLRLVAYERFEPMPAL